MYYIKGPLDIPEPLTVAGRKRVQGVPLHFDLAIFLKKIAKFKIH